MLKYALGDKEEHFCCLLMYFVILKYSGLVAILKVCVCTCVRVRTCVCMSPLGARRVSGLLELELWMALGEDDAFRRYLIIMVLINLKRWLGG